MRLLRGFLDYYRGARATYSPWSCVVHCPLPLTLTSTQSRSTSLVSFHQAAVQALTVGAHWKTSQQVGMLVILFAAVHSFYMREYWVTIKGTPLVYRYMDWSSTVSLRMTKFYCVLGAVIPDLGAGLFWRSLVGTVVMRAFGYLGE